MRGTLALYAALTITCASAASCNQVLGIGDVTPGAASDARPDGTPDAPIAPTGVHVTGGIASLPTPASATNLHVREPRLDVGARTCTTTLPTICVTGGMTP